MANGKPHVHEPQVTANNTYFSDGGGVMQYGRRGWILNYGDTNVAIPEAPALQPEAIQSALTEAIRLHDEGSKELQAREAVLATVGKLKGKKVWASEELAKPPASAGFFRRLIHKGANS